jgi:3-phosphoshikimate 1-carboxyvinyltransferase
LIKISKEDHQLNGTVELPFSKSISIRAQLLSFLHPGTISINNISSASDSILLESLLQKIEVHRENGQGVLSLDVGNSGAVMRFLIAVLSGREGEYLVTGSPRMAHRPVGILVNSLRQLDAEIDYLEKPGHLPLIIRGKKLRSKQIIVDASESSQHISALLILGSALEGGLSVILRGKIVSGAYIDMTLKMLEGSGFRVSGSGPVMRATPEGSFPGSESRIDVLPGSFRKTDIEIEKDWSGAAFWYSMMALAEGGKIFFPGLKFSGMQGDEIVAGMFEHLGVETEETPKGISISKGTPSGSLPEWDFSDYPDLAPAVMATCALLPEKAVFTGLERLQIKESDRLRSMQEELAKIGCMLLSDRSGKWHLVPGNACKKMIVFNPHDDHRIAMAMAAVVMKDFGFIIDNESVVYKSYPTFWKDMEQLGFMVR